MLSCSSEVKNDEPKETDSVDKSESLSEQMKRLESLKNKTVTNAPKIEKKPSNKKIEWLLAGGRMIEVYESGLEAKLLRKLEGKSKTDERYFAFDRISFKTGSAELNNSSLDQIKLVATIMRAFRDRVFLVRGHTDSIGGAKANKTLSFKRANSLKQALLDYGVSRNTVRTQGMGPDEPVASNETKEGREMNRRIDISIAR